VLAAACHHRLASVAQLRRQYLAAEAQAALPPRPRRGGPRDPADGEVRALARLLAKDLVLEHLRRVWPAVKAGRANIEIRSRDAGRGVKPRIWLFGRLLGWSLSISHTRRAALAAVSMRPDVVVGVDLVTLTALGRGFEQMWFTPGEQRWSQVAADPSRACLVWAIKEAAYKALNHGEPFAPLAVEVVPEPAGGFALRWRGRRWPHPLHLDVRTVDGQVVALVAARLPRQARDALQRPTAGLAVEMPTFDVEPFPPALRADRLGNLPSRSCAR
jgi:phosphopantetheinyl transferase (holo-ACP synthase)